VHVQQLDPARVDEVVAVLRAAHEHDLPRDPAFTPQWEKLRILNPSPDEPTTHWVAIAEGAVVGHAQLTLPDLDNPTNSLGNVTVRPDTRRRGVGRLLWDHIADLARADGRKFVFFEASEGSPGEAFAGAIDAELGIYSARRMLQVDDTVRATARALEGSARAAGTGYELHVFAGATPEQFLAGSAYLWGRMSTDAPLENLALQPEAYDAARLAAREAAAARQGLVVHNALAVHSASGAVVGMTNIGLAPEDLTHGWQWNTIVDPDHRGHRLGTWIKAANLLEVLRLHPGMRTVLTWNAASNDHMIAVNEAMGFRLWDHWGEWQARL
jgi:GNAT superfamily N-acetyltransferase